MKARRDGNILKTGKIGNVNCIWQEMLMPGERMNMGLQGSVRLETLRERDVMRINAHLAVFMTPLRWLWPEFPDYLKEGPDTAIVPPTQTGFANWEAFGVGSYKGNANGTLYKWFVDNPQKVYDEWYKFPEDPDSVTWLEHGLPAVPLSTPWSRCRYTATPDDTDDYLIDVSGSTMDVRDLADRKSVM